METLLSLPSTSVLPSVVIDGESLDASCQSSQHVTRRIVVGYAFSEKKLSTMGVVMAEASRTKLRHHLGPPIPRPLHSNRSMSFSSLAIEPIADPDASQRTSGGHGNPTSDTDSFHSSSFPTATTWSPAARMDPSPHSNVVFSLESGSYGGNDSPVEPGPDDRREANVDQVVRYFRSSCCSSLAEESASTATSTLCSSAPSATRAINANAAPTSTLAQHCSGAPSSHSLQRLQVQQHQQQPLLHLAFVPIDPDQPIEDQHGGNIDIILHKLTEDILCLAQVQSSLQLDQHHEPKEATWTESHRTAERRIRNLVDFSQRRGCCLLDDPRCVQALMQRDSISARLEQCLQHVQSTSGVPVTTPRWTVVGVDHPARDVVEANLRYPLISKPLIAAGTSASHAMAVLLDASGLEQWQQGKKQHLCQEYYNHDEILYKVYVLGSHVSVHKRRSLPNLPRSPSPSGGSPNDHNLQAPPRRMSVVEFDSQRPYPRLSDFGFVSSKKRPRSESFAGGPQVTQSSPVVVVTADEVAPIVHAIKTAFGLNLFGFDVLVQSRSHDGSNPVLLVVDVNYFPSYKEVDNFPSLLAEYVSQRVLEDLKQRRLTL